jgi:selenocysteine-specific elongation factor
VIVGTAGHIDHGKTALVGALTGVDTDRLKEEKARGISIDLGFAYLPAPDGGVVGFVDVPGHERFVHTMLAGAGGTDFALLLVAADDGVMPQTREHLAILKLLGIEAGAVVLSKADLADEARRAAVGAEIAALTAGGPFADAPVFAVSTLTGEGVDDLRAHLFAAAAAQAGRAAGGAFRLAVDRAFTLAGAGTVVTGTVLSGTVAVGDRVVVGPAGHAARVRSIHAQNRPAERGAAGDRCALNLAGEAISRDAVHRGDVVHDPALHAPTARIDATLAVLESETKPVGAWFPARLHVGAAEVGARIVPLGAPVAPGAQGLVQLVLDRPIAAAAGDRYVLRDTSARRTLGGGRFLDLRAPQRRRATPERLAQLASHAHVDPATAAAALLAAPPAVLDLTGFARDRALGAGASDRLAADLGVVTLPNGAAVVAISADGWTAFRSALAATLAGFHADNPDLPGIGVERLRLALAPRLPKPAFLAAVDGLVRGGAAAVDGAFVRLPGHTVRLTAADEALWARIAPRLSGDERFRPPRVRDLANAFDAPEADVRRLMKLAGRLGRVLEVAHDHFFARDTVAEMVAILEDVARTSPDGRFTAAQFRDRVDNGRKVAIQILEFLDRHGVTLRRGDLRRLNPHRLDQFRPAVETGAAAAAADDTSGLEGGSRGADAPPGDASAGDTPIRDGPAGDAPAGDRLGGEASPVGRPDFKSGWGREPVPGGFDSHSPPPVS